MVPELVSCFERSLAFIQDSVADLADEEIVLQPPGVPNHAAWTLGHVIFSCQGERKRDRRAYSGDCWFPLGFLGR